MDVKTGHAYELFWDFIQFHKFRVRARSVQIFPRVVFLTTLCMTSLHVAIYIYLFCIVNPIRIFIELCHNHYPSFNEFVFRPEHCGLKCRSKSVEIVQNIAFMIWATFDFELAYDAESVNRSQLNFLNICVANKYENSRRWLKWVHWLIRPTWNYNRKSLKLPDNSSDRISTIVNSFGQ